VSVIEDGFFSSRARVTVITPTLARRVEKLVVAAASVKAQTFQQWRHLIISDGPPVDPDVDSYGFQALRRTIDWRTHGMFLGAHHETPGHWNRLLGGLLAETPYVAYLDDDNTWRPRHLELAVRALDEHPEVGFVYPRMQRPEGDVLGTDPLRVGRCINYIDASMLVHRRELLSEVATWDPHQAPEHLRYALDGFVVQKWLIAGVRYVQIPEITVDYSGVGYWLDGGGAPQLAPDSLGEVH